MYVDLIAKFLKTSSIPGIFGKLLLICLLSPFTLVAQQSKGYEITGHIIGLKEGEKVTMMLWNSIGVGNLFDQLSKQDSAYVKNGEFHLKGIVPDGPRRYFLDFDRHDGSPKYPVIKTLQLYIDNGEQITIQSPDIESIQHSQITHYVNIEGSPTNYSMRCLEPMALLYQQSVSRLNNYANRIKDSLGFDASILDGIFASKIEITNAYYYSFLYHDRGDPELNKGRLFLPVGFGILQKSGYSPVWVDIYKDLTGEEKNSFLGKALKKLITVCMGQPFPDFALPMPSGKTLALNEVVSKSKVTLVHFWSDQPTEQSSRDELEGLFKKYHDKGLNIVCFSSDIYNERWIDAIEKYHLSSWYNVNDRNGKDGLVRKIYLQGSLDVGSNNALIDEKGKIIAYDVSGAELEWYLWRAFKN